MRFPLVSVRFLSVSVRFPGFRQRHFIGARRNVRDFIADDRSEVSVMPALDFRDAVALGCCALSVAASAS